MLAAGDEEDSRALFKGTILALGLAAFFAVAGVGAGLAARAVGFWLLAGLMLVSAYGAWVASKEKAAAAARLRAGGMAEFLRRCGAGGRLGPMADNIHYPRGGK